MKASGNHVQHMRGPEVKSREVFGRLGDERFKRKSAFWLLFSASKAEAENAQRRIRSAEKHRPGLA